MGGGVEEAIECGVEEVGEKVDMETVGERSSERDGGVRIHKGSTSI